MTDDKKPTIEELEAILNSEDSYVININPDGSITAVPRPPAKTADILQFARRDPGQY
jgi:hypothetical protein